MKRLLSILILLALIVVGSICLYALSNLSIDDAQRSELSFEFKGAKLEGTLVLPLNVESAPVVILIHGDGPLDRFADEGYYPLINKFLSAGIGVYTWDKQGTGKSTGNWLDQSLQDRADEAVQALELIRSQRGVQQDRVGFLGFSQAGWVIPIAATRGNPSFSVIIGAAVNWRRQGIYYTKLRLEKDGLSSSEIDNIVANQTLENDSIFISRQSAPSPTDYQGMERARFDFVRRNYSADATQDLHSMKAPVLAIWGADDLNVNTVQEAEDYRKIFAGSTNKSVVVIPNATHTLLRAPLFNYQLVSQWPYWKRFCFLVLGKHSYTPDALEMIIDWIDP